MACTREVVTSTVVFATLWTLAGRGIEAQTMPLFLTVSIHNFAALSPSVVERATGVATKIFGQIDVSLKWVDGHRHGGAMPANPAVPDALSGPLIYVRLVPRPGNPQLPANILGYAASGGTLASVVIQRVELAARRKGYDVSDLLGAAMAHEIGHLLLPPNPHSGRGIMAPVLDLFRVGQGGLSFNQHQASLIQARIASMSRVQQARTQAGRHDQGVLQVSK